VNKDKVLEIARECGLGYVIDENDHGDDLEAFAAAIREECAKLADSMLERDSNGENDYPEVQPSPTDVARAIRNMGKEG
jgi:hypothetical protein